MVSAYDAVRSRKSAPIACRSFNPDGKSVRNEGSALRGQAGLLATAGGSVRVKRTGTIVLALLIAAATPMASAGAADDAVTAINRDLGIQTQFPTDAPPSSVVHIDASGTTANTLLWIALILGGITLALALRGALPVGVSRRARWGKQRSESAAPQDSERQTIAATADDLAAAGRFSEAMHLLLLTSLADLAGRLDMRIAASLTSREIVRRVDLDPAGKDAFRRLVEAVELVHFGGRDADAARYAQCRSEYDQLSRSLAARRRTA